MGEIVRIGDRVSLTLQYGSDVGLPNNSARAVVADVLARNGLSLTQYDNSQLGFFGGPVTLTVLLQGSDYSDKQDVAGHVAGIIYNELGLSVNSSYATSVIRGSQWTVDAGVEGQGIPTIDGGVLAIVNVPIPLEQINPAPHTQDWLDRLAQQLGMSRSTLQVAGVAVLALVVVVGMRR